MGQQNYPSQFSSTEVKYVRSTIEKQAQEILPWIYVTTITSLMLSSLILITGIVWYKEQVKSKIYMKIILMISLCDWFGTFVRSWGYPTHKFACDFQGFVSVFFFRASWFWVSAAIIVVYFHIRTSKLPKYIKFRHLNGYIWILNSILQFIPFLYSDSYGGCYNGLSYGRLQWLGKDTLRDQLISDYGWLTLVIMICASLPMYLYCVTLPNVWKNGGPQIYRTMQNVCKHMILYPVAMLLFWGPATSYSTYAGIHYKYDTETVDQFINNNFMYLLFGTITNLFGTACSLLFIWKSNETRARWYYLYQNYKNRNGGSIVILMKKDTVKGKTNISRVSGSGSTKSSSSNINIPSSIRTNGNSITSNISSKVSSLKENSPVEFNDYFDNRNSINLDLDLDTKNNTEEISNYRDGSSFFSLSDMGIEEDFLEDDEYDEDIPFVMDDDMSNPNNLNINNTNINGGDDDDDRTSARSPIPGLGLSSINENNPTVNEL
jgi:hypothetical protein